MPLILTSEELTVSFSGFDLLSLVPRGGESFLSVRCGTHYSRFTAEKEENRIASVHAIHEADEVCSVSFGKMTAYFHPTRPAFTVLYSTEPNTVFHLLPSEGTDHFLIPHFPVGKQTMPVFLLRRGDQTLFVSADGAEERGGVGTFRFPNGGGQLLFSLGDPAKASAVFCAMRAGEDVLLLRTRLPQNRVFTGLLQKIREERLHLQSLLSPSFAFSAEGERLCSAASALLPECAALSVSPFLDTETYAAAIRFLSSAGYPGNAAALFGWLTALSEAHGFLTCFPRYRPLTEQERCARHPSAGALRFLSLLSCLPPAAFPVSEKLMRGAYRAVLSDLQNGMLPPPDPGKEVGERAEWGDAAQTARFLAILPYLAARLPDLATETERLSACIRSAFTANFCPDGKTFVPSSPARLRSGYRRHTLYARCPVCGSPSTLFRVDSSYRCPLCLDSVGLEIQTPAPAADAVFRTRALCPGLVPDAALNAALNDAGDASTLSTRALADYLSCSPPSPYLLHCALSRLEDGHDPLPDRLSLCTVLLTEYRKRS